MLTLPDSTDNRGLTAPASLAAILAPPLPPATPMRCHVYRCPRRTGTYVFLADRDAFDRLPPSLRGQLGELEFAFEFALDAGRAVAQADPAVVRANLTAHGFHVHFPPIFDTAHAG
jgi:uncharacterized protein